VLVYGAMPRKKRPRVDTVLSVVVSVVDQITREARVVSAIVLQPLGVCRREGEYCNRSNTAIKGH
jgi:hypothetical protein